MSLSLPACVRAERVREVEAEMRELRAEADHQAREAGTLQVRAPMGHHTTLHHACLPACLRLMPCAVAWQCMHSFL